MESYGIVEDSEKKGVSTYLKILISQYQFKLIGLEEAMIANYEDSVLRQFDLHQDYLWKWIPSKVKSGGILCGIKNEYFDVGSFEQGEFMIQLNLWDKIIKIKWNLLIVYGAAQEEYKDAFLAELSSFYSTNVEPMLIGGDFNIIRYS